jgi:hypothetical protein
MSRADQFLHYLTDTILSLVLLNEIYPDFKIFSVFSFSQNWLKSLEI